MKALDPKIGELHRTYWETELKRAGTKTVLLVEGDNDKDIIEEIFRRRRRSWDRQIHIVVAGGRKNVLQRMQSNNTFPTGWGIVDRDVWSNSDVAMHKAELSQLFVTSGWCIENIFLEPGFLRQVDAGVAARVSVERERWVRAGAFWWAFQRVREAQQQWGEKLRDGTTAPTEDEHRWNYGVPCDGLNLGSADELTRSLESRIPSNLRQDANFDLQMLAEQFEKRANELLSLREVEQWQLGVHGKTAFDRLLAPILCDVFGNQSSWRTTLASRYELGCPEPLSAMMSVLLP